MELGVRDGRSTRAPSSGVLLLEAHPSRPGPESRNGARAGRPGAREPPEGPRRVLRIAQPSPHLLQAASDRRAGPDKSPLRPAGGKTLPCQRPVSSQPGHSKRRVVPTTPFFQSRRVEGGGQRSRASARTPHGLVSWGRAFRGRTEAGEGPDPRWMGPALSSWPGGFL